MTRTTRNRIRWTATTLACVVTTLHCFTFNWCLLVTYCVADILDPDAKDFQRVWQHWAGVGRSAVELVQEVAQRLRAGWSAAIR